MISHDIQLPFSLRTLRHQRLLAVCSARNQPQPVKLRQRLKHHGRMRKWLYFAAWKIRRSAGVGQRSRNDSIVVRRASDWSGRTWKAVKILTLAPRNKTSRGTWSGLAAVTESPIAISWHIWHGNTLYSLNGVCFQKTVFAAHYGFRFWRSPRLCQCSCIWLADPSLAA